MKYSRKRDDEKNKRQTIIAYKKKNKTGTVFYFSKTVLERRN